MCLRGISWKEIGLCRPKNYRKSVFSIAFIFGFTVVSIMLFQMAKEQFGWQIEPDHSAEVAPAKFGNLAGKWQAAYGL